MEKFTWKKKKKSLAEYVKPFPSEQMEITNRLAALKNLKTLFENITNF